MLAHWLRARRFVLVPHRSLYSRIQPTNNTLPRFLTMASTLDALNAELAQQTELFNRLRVDNSDPAALEESRRRLGEIKRELAALKPSGKDAKKKERLLLKTPKVRTSTTRRRYFMDRMDPPGHARLWSRRDVLSRVRRAYRQGVLRVVRRRAARHACL
jgi:hypothetical protein